jgi:hypothetical protein
MPLGDRGVFSLWKKTLGASASGCDHADFAIAARRGLDFGLSFLK